MRCKIPPMVASLRGRPAQPSLFEVEPSEDTSLLRARQVTHGVISALWASRAGESQLPLRPTGDFGLVLRPVPLAPEDRERVEEMARRWRDEPLLQVAYQVGRLFTSLLPSDYRSRLGIYFTPPALADRLLDLSEEAGADLATCRILDPACGGGAFLAPVILRKLPALRRKRARTAIEALTTQVRGYELDPFAAWLSQVFAELATLPLLCKGGERLPVLVEVRDTLAAQPSDAERFDLVLGNPPYSKLRLDEEWRRVYHRSLFGHANLYGLFTDQALRHLSDRGLVSFVTPTSFLGGEYFKQLRRLLLAEAPPAHLEFVADREGIFDDVLQETLLAVYRRAPRLPAVRVALLEVRDERIRRIEHCGEIALPQATGEPWLLPRSAGQTHLVSEAGRSPFRLRDYGFGVSTGPLVWNRHKDQLRQGPGPGTVPLIWAESVASDGTFSFRAEKRNHQPFLRLRGAVDEWLRVSDPCVLVQRTTAKEQDRRLIAAPLPETFFAQHGSVSVENHLNMVRPTEGQPKMTLAALAALLNSRVVDQLFRCINGSVAVSAYELEALPLPSPEAVAAIEKLLQSGAPPEAIERAIEKGYALGGQAAAA